MIARNRKTWSKIAFNIIPKGSVLSVKKGLLYSLIKSDKPVLQWMFWRIVNKEKMWETMSFNARNVKKITISWKRSIWIIAKPQ